VVLSGVNASYYITKIDEVKRDLVNHQKSYSLWSLKKGEMWNQWGELLEGLNIEIGKPINKIATQMIEEAEDMGILSGARDYIYKIIKEEWKDDEYKKNRKHHVENSTYPEADQNFTRLETEEQVEQVKKQLEEAKQMLRKVKGKEKYLTEIKHISKEIIRGARKTPKITQEETPENLQKEGEMFKKLGEMSHKCIEWQLMFDDIQKEVKIYPPNEQDDIAYAQGIERFTKYVDNLFSFFKPLKDRKWTCGILKWFKIQQDNIDHGKHAAGKKAAVIILDGYGKPIPDKKGKPIHRFMTRERVGDNEKPTFELATKLIESITGMKDMETWLSKYQEGQRAARKYYKAPDFSEAAFGSDEQ